MEATEVVSAASGAVIVRDSAAGEWRVTAYAREGRLQALPYASAVPLTMDSPLGSEAERPAPDGKRVPIIFELAEGADARWPGMLDYHRGVGDARLLIFPLAFGERLVGYMVLSFATDAAAKLQESEILAAIAQGATISIELARRANAARDAAVLVERNRIAQEIHDGIAQAFTGILLQLGAAEELGSREPGAHRELFARVGDLAREGLAEARRSVMALRPQQSRCSGLEAALRRLAMLSTVPAGITTTVEGSGWTLSLSPEHEHELLRIVQEAVSNAVRHAEPRTIRIALDEEEAHWVLRVTDDGKGLQTDFEYAAQEGFGLTSMRERAVAIGAEWRINSERGLGTRITVRLPKQARP